MLCDVCNAAVIRSEGVVLPHLAFVRLLQQGFGIDETSIGGLMEAGLTRQEAIRQLIDSYVRMDSDWLLCPTCAKQAERVMAALASGRQNTKCQRDLRKVDFWVQLPPSIQDREGICTARMVLDPLIGEETVLVIQDPTPFVHEVAAVRPFRLNLKAMTLRTEWGCPMVLLWWVAAPGLPEEPFVIYENFVNMNEPACLAPYEALDGQTHVHVLLLGKGADMVDCFEFENGFELDVTLRCAREIAPRNPCLDFGAAKQSVLDRYSLEDLFYG